MKPLTIEQVRNFEADAWVWIVSGDNGCYAQIQYRDANGLNVQRGKFSYWMNNSDYGKTWLAYRNKQEAEAKGEIVELPCKVGTIVYRIRDMYSEEDTVYTIEPTPFRIGLMDDWEIWAFATREEAEKRLEELQE